LPTSMPDSSSSGSQPVLPQPKVQNLLCSPYLYWPKPALSQTSPLSLEATSTQQPSPPPCPSLSWVTLTTMGPPPGVCGPPHTVLLVLYASSVSLTHHISSHPKAFAYVFPSFWSVLSLYSFYPVVPIRSQPSAVSSGRSPQPLF
jgi:hypothetical protein